MYAADIESENVRFERMPCVREKHKIIKKPEWTYTREIIMWEKISQSDERNNNKCTIRCKSKSFVVFRVFTLLVRIFFPVLHQWWVRKRKEMQLHFCFVVFFFSLFFPPRYRWHRCTYIAGSERWVTSVRPRTFLVKQRTLLFRLRTKRRRQSVVSKKASSL